MQPRWRERPSLDENGRFDGSEIVGFNTEGLTSDERASLRRQLETLLAPMPPGKILQELAKLALVMKSREANATDFKAMVAIYAADLSNCSTYGLASALSVIRNRDVFFPAIAEIRGEVDKAEGRFRMALASLNAPVKSIARGQTEPSRYLSVFQRDMVAKGLWEVKPNGDLTLTQEGRNKAVEASA